MEGTVGRDSVIDRLVRAVAHTGSRGVVLVGPAGIGKSHLARHVAERQGDDTAVVRVTGSRATADVPFGAFAPLMPADAESLGAPATHLVRVGLAEAAGGRRVLLVVDDVHELDEASAALVHQLAVSGDATVVATQRSGAPTGDTVARLWRDDVLERIDLGPLDRDAIERLTAHVLGGPVSSRAVTLVHERSGGNPLYVKELVLATSETGEWTRCDEDGAWDWTAGASTTPRLAELLGDKLAQLSDDERDALVHIAFGEPLGLGELQAITDDLVIDSLERSGLITAEVDGRRLHVRLAHPMHADVLRRGVSPLRARLIRATLSNVLAATGARRREDDMRLATLALDAGVTVDPTVLARAARIALFGNDRHLAVRLAQAAFETAPTFESGHALADALYEQGAFGPMVDHWAEWQHLCTTPEQRAILRMHQAIAHYYRNADDTAAHESIDEIVAELTSGPWHDEAVALRATLLTISGRVTDAWTLAAPLLVDRAADRVLIQAALAGAHSLRALGRCGEALTVADRAIDSYRTLGPQATLVSSAMLGVTRCLSLVTQGDLATALSVGDEARNAAVLAGDISTEGAAELVRADILGMMGRIEAARRAVATSESAFARLNHLAFRRWAVSQRCLLATFDGDGDALAAGLANLAALGPHPAVLFEHASIIATAWTSHQQGDAATAASVLQGGAQRLEARGESMGAALCWNALARLGSQGAGAPLTRLAASMEGALVPALARHASAVDASDGDALLAAAEELAALGALTWALPAAEQAARSTAAERTRTRAEALLVQWRADIGLEASAEASADRARTSDDDIVLAALTRREREVALLAAQGLPSRTIGERLFLSPRTVENHLARAYDKLGVRSRAELAHALAAA